MAFRTDLSKICLLMIFAATGQTGLCQENFLPGYVIQRGDTTSGLIDYRNWNLNPDVILFKESEDASPVEYRPFEIDRFSVADELYESAIVQTDISPGPLDPLAETSGPFGRLEADTTFLQTLVSGEKSLYFLVNRLKRNQFYIRKDSGFDLLVYKEYISTHGNTRGIVENNLYRNQLALYLRDCDRIQSMLGNLGYSQKRMLKLFTSYYDCSGSEIEFRKKPEKVLVEFGVLAGSSFTSMDIRGLTHLEQGGSDPSIDFSAGLFLELILPRAQRKWSLNHELTYSSYTITRRYNEYSSDDLYTIHQSTLGYSYVKLNNMVRFKYPVSNFFLYANAGISNGFAIREINSLVRDIKQYTTERVEHGNVISDTRKYEQGYLFGIGAKLRDLSLEIRLEKGNGMSVLPALRTSTTRYFLMLGYKI